VDINILQMLDASESLATIGLRNMVALAAVLLKNGSIASDAK
jgi:hypothetical protein